MTKTVSFKVGMTCGGCKGAVTRILTKIEGNLLSSRLDFDVLKSNVKY